MTSSFNFCLLILSHHQVSLGDSMDLFYPLDQSDFSGKFPDIWRIFRKRFNISDSFYIRQDGKWGTQNNAGEWDGMISSLLNGEADMLLAPLTMTVGRSQVVNFLLPLGKSVFFTV